MSHSALFKNLIYKKYPKNTEYVIARLRLSNNILIKNHLSCHHDKNAAYKHALAEAIHLLYNKYIITEKTLRILASKSSPEFKFNALQEEYETLFDDDCYAKIVVKKHNIESPVVKRIHNEYKFKTTKTRPVWERGTDNRLSRKFVSNSKLYNLRDYTTFYFRTKRLEHFNENDNFCIDHVKCL